MMTTYTEADLTIDLETTGRGEEAEGWRTQRVRWWKDDASMVDAVAVGSGWWTLNGEMPFEQVGF